jgi:hypothetical protein
VFYVPSDYTEAGFAIRFFLKLGMKTGERIKILGDKT